MEQEELNFPQIVYENLSNRLNRLRQLSDPQEETPVHDTQLLQQLAQINETCQKQIRKEENARCQIRTINKNCSSLGSRGVNTTARRNASSSNLNHLNAGKQSDHSHYQDIGLKQVGLKKVMSQRFCLTSTVEAQENRTDFSPIKGFNQRFRQQIQLQRKLNFQSPNQKVGQRLRNSMSNGRSYKQSIQYSMGSTEIDQFAIGTIRRNRNGVLNQAFGKMLPKNGRIVRNGYR